MKVKRILSSALTAVILFTTIVAAMPIEASAAHSAIVDTTSQYTTDEIKANILQPMLQYNYSSADEMLAYELEMGYLDYISSADKKFSLYANRYTGVVYYVNNVTGQILTTNPYNPAYATISDTIKTDLMSQVIITYSTVGSSSLPKSYDSYNWAAAYGQISVSPIASGLRVNYTLGDTSLRFLLPECVPATDFENDIIIPALLNLEEVILDNLKDDAMEPSFGYLDDEGKIPDSQRDNFGSVDTRKLKSYLEGLSAKVSTYCTDASVTSIQKNISDAITFFTSTYSVKNPGKYDEKDEYGREVLAQMYKDYPVTAEGTVVYAVSSDIKKDEIGNQKRKNANILRALCPEYTFSMMYGAENACGITVKTIDKPLFRCAIEYSINEDGTLSVDLPSSSITYDETAYVVNSISINKHFGCGDMLEDGYIFYPDGSGTIVEFSDFYSNVNSERQNVSLSGSVYGIDYAYSTITGAHRENIAFPVYGMVSTVGTTAMTSKFISSDKTRGGFFAVIEEGDSLSQIAFTTGGSQHKFASAYTIYQPYASDTFDLSATLSVSGLTEHKAFASERYNGSYRLRIQMLTDSELGNATDPFGYYDATYIGMANFYRNYLKERGVLTKLESVKDDLPLYIEALGSMEITKKILTFPVTVSIPLTKFEDITAMYEDFTDAINKLTKKAQEYQALADAENKDLLLKKKYQETADEYVRISAEVQNITNINFKLTGFANGGMKFTYPAKVRWEKACGGEDGLIALLETAKQYNGANSTFEIFPEFDFLYINNSAMFDGVSNREHASLMIDNRYASKQVYNNISRKFETFFTMVVNSAVIDELYTKFQKDYSKIVNKNLSVSTLGSDLNSNFDVDDVIDREESKANVTALLDRMANDDGYELMINGGNIYAAKFATHILDISIDSSHFRYSSYSIPFTGLILHSYVNYAGGALNYAGSEDYDLLRSIENGASLYYILCYDNTNYMKNDPDLTKYFGVDYFNWYDSIVSSYSKLNAAIGHLQSYEIVDHKVVYAERKLDDEENKALLGLLGDEFVDFADKQIYAMVNAAFDEMISDPANKGRGIKVTVDIDALISEAVLLFDTDADTLAKTGFNDKLAAVVEYYETKYSGEGSTGTPYEINYSEVVYNETYATAYNAITSSVCTDKNYDKTDYTCDLGNVVIVTYANEYGDSETFILNYNIYDVEVRLEDGRVITLAKYGYQPI